MWCTITNTNAASAHRTTPRRGTLAGDQVSFTVTPTTKKTRYVVVLPGTSAHGPDHATITVIVKNPAGGPSPGPSPGSG